ncbi:FecR domain-containing protein [Olivibacter domesticus]|uniref:FecR family protein n=1 Tax=Olivibacter domesticus TaxID=407022 RepID=A0A1H7U4K5_OLID1|nr:FecR domain-containing protein [Olivibacter domesticus]SEL91608.1 FecR family protein [Olivibacter domesticus]
MDNQNSNITPLLRKYIDNTCKQEELLSLFEYFAVADEEELRLQIRELINKEETIMKEEQDHLQTIKYRLLEQIGKERPEHRSNYLSHYVRYAAAVILVIFITKVLVGYFSKVPTEQQMSSTENRYRTKIFQQQNFSSDVRELKLADGSKVKLYPQSTVLYSESFGKDNRNIELVKGHARFEVEPIPGLPFIVKSNRLLTKVLGTIFDVDLRSKNYADIKLLKGKVVVYSGKDFEKETYLMPGKKLSLNLETGLVDVTAIEKTRSLKKTPTSKFTEPTASLLFRNTTVSETLRTLEKYYNVSIDYEDQDVKNLYFTGNFEEDMPLSTALSIICNMNNLSFDQHGDTVLIKKKTK